MDAAGRKSSKSKGRSSKVEAYFSEHDLLRAVVRRTSGTLRFVDSVLRSFSLSAISRFIETASGVFGFLASADTTSSSSSSSDCVEMIRRDLVGDTGHLRDRLHLRVGQLWTAQDSDRDQLVRIADQDGPFLARALSGSRHFLGNVHLRQPLHRRLLIVLVVGNLGFRRRVRRSACPLPAPAPPPARHRASRRTRASRSTHRSAPGRQKAKREESSRSSRWRRRRRPARDRRRAEPEGRVVRAHASASAPCAASRRTSWATSPRRKKSMSGVLTPMSMSYRGLSHCPSAAVTVAARCSSGPSAN